MWRSSRYKCSVWLRRESTAQRTEGLVLVTTSTRWYIPRITNSVKKKISQVQRSRLRITTGDDEEPLGSCDRAAGPRLTVGSRSWLFFSRLTPLHLGNVKVQHLHHIWPKARDAPWNLPPSLPQTLHLSRFKFQVDVRAFGTRTRIQINQMD